MKRSSCAEFVEEVQLKRQKVSNMKETYPSLRYKFSIGDIVRLPSKNLFVNFDTSLKPNGCGIFYEEDYIIQMSWKNGVINGEMIVVNRALHCLIGIYDIHNNMVLSVIDGLHFVKDTINLSDKGDRWEGTVYNGEACGWGELYDENNLLEYMGFRFGSRNICYGRSYHKDLKEIMYDGMVHNNVRYGLGKLIARNGTLVYDGPWLNDCYLEKSVVYDTYSGSNSISPFTERLVFPSETTYVNDDIDLSWLFHLKYLNVQPNTFVFSPDNSLYSLTVQHLNYLESIRIEQNTFQRIKTVRFTSLQTFVN